MNPFEGLHVERQDGDEDEGYQEGWYLDPSDQSAISLLYRTSTAIDHLDRLERWIVEVAWCTGLRVRELWSLHIDDVHSRRSGTRRT